MPARILLIDDDARLVEMLGAYLRSRGYQVEVRGDGDVGARRADAAPGMGAVILDVMLPGIDGLEVCRRMRAHSQIPILMLTARGDDMDRTIGLGIGADDYLPKPFDPRELLARLARSAPARAATGQPEDVLNFGPLEIDRAAREVRVRGQRRELTGRRQSAAAPGRAGGPRADERTNHGSAQGEEWDSVDQHRRAHSRIRQLIEDDARHPRSCKLCAAPATC